MDRHRNHSADNRDTELNDNDAGLAIGADNAAPHPVAGLADVTAMVRSLQRRAGLTDCFRRGDPECDRSDCDWRIHCLDMPTDRDGGEGEPPTG